MKFGRQIFTSKTLPPTSQKKRTPFIIIRYFFQPVPPHAHTFYIPTTTFIWHLNVVFFVKGFIDTFCRIKQVYVGKNRGGQLVKKERKK